MDNEKSEIEKLTAAMKIANHRNVWWYGFGRGIMFGLGSTLGLAIVVIFLIYILKAVQFVPWFGDKIKNFVEPIVNQLQQESTIR